MNYVKLLLCILVVPLAYAGNPFRPELPDEHMPNVQCYAEIFNMDHSINIFSYKKFIKRINIDDGAINKFKFSDDSKLLTLYLRCPERVQVWDMNSWNIISETPKIRYIIYKPDILDGHILKKLLSLSKCGIQLHGLEKN